ncbi:IPT/TIG domain-containing protein [Chitinophaga parva]|nr:IPT/TIG domain-containing protein [Chitinophaga parva]
MKHALYLLVAVLLLGACRRDDKNKVDATLRVNSFLPGSGNPGTVVTIHGTGFRGNFPDNNVTFNGKGARIMDATDTTLIVAAPDSGSTGPIAVTVAGKTVTGETYTYQALSVHAISPSNGPAGTTVTITGAGFTGTAGPAVVTVNGQKAIVTNANDTTLVITVPAGAGSGALTVDVNGQHASGPQFTSQLISKIKPVTGGPGTTITLTGEGFSTHAGDNVVAINGITSKVVSATATSLVITAGSDVQTGPVSVTINGQKTSGPVFTKVPVPVVSQIAPMSGPVGSKLTITGNNFSALTDEDAITVNGVPATLLSASGQQLQVTVPAGTTSGAVKVVVNGQSVTGPVFTVQSLGIISLLPDNGLAGAVVTVKGTGFDPNPANNQLTLNGIPVPISAATDSTLTVTMPNGTATGNMQLSTGSLHAQSPLFRHAGVKTFFADPTITGYTGLAIDSKGNVYYASNFVIYKVPPDGSGKTIFAGSETEQGNTNGNGTTARFSYIFGITADAQDNIYVADNNNAIRKITPDGTVVPYLNNMSNTAKSLSMDDRNNVCFGTDYSGTYKIDAKTLAVTQLSFTGVTYPFVVINNIAYYGGTDAAQYYAFDMSIRSRTTLAGNNYDGGWVDGLPGTSRLGNPGSSVYNPASNTIYFLDGGNFAVRSITLPTNNTGSLTGGKLSYQQYKYGYADGGLGDALFNFSQTGPMAIDKNGNIYVLEVNNHAIREIFLQ